MAVEPVRRIESQFNMLLDDESGVREDLALRDID